MIHPARVISALKRIGAMSDRLSQIQTALGRIEQRQVQAAGVDISEAEFKVFSQWGEDGLIQYLIHRVPIERQLFLEFGVENYTEANTRFLAINNQWAGLVIDGDPDNVAYIRSDPIYWATNLKAEQAFITKDNINDLITRNGIQGDIGLLSVDIDGNDYWVWDAINCVSPRIVICEYNSLFGPTAKVTTPYDPVFVRSRAHFSQTYYGASVAALVTLGEAKGYALVAGNAAGNNLFFARRDVLGGLRVLTPSEAYRKAQFREHHDEQGNLTFHDFATRLDLLKHVEIYDFSTMSLRPIKDIPGIV